MDVERVESEGGEGREIDQARRWVAGGIDDAEVQGRKTGEMSHGIECGQLGSVSQ